MKRGRTVDMSSVSSSSSSDESEGENQEGSQISVKSFKKVNLFQ